jgi:hypothetical protein
MQNHQNPYPVSDAITGLVIVVLGSLGTCFVVWAWRTAVQVLA